MLHSGKKILLLFFSLISLSCVKEDLSQCESGLLLTFKYELNTRFWELGRPVDLFGESVSYLSVLFFDSEDRFFKEYEGVDVLGNKDYKLRMRLPMGRYTALVWGSGEMKHNYNYCQIIDPDKSIYEKKLVRGVTSLEDFRMIIKHNSLYDGEYIVIEPQGDLYYGIVDGVRIGSDPNHISEYTVDMMRNTHKVKVIINRVGWKGDILKEKPPYEVFCTARNARFNYDNSIADDALPVKYTAKAVVKNESQFEYEYNMLRLMKDRDVKLVVNDAGGGRGILTVDVVKSILANPKYETQEDLDRESLYEFEVNIYPNMSVEVFINGWKSYDVDIEI